MYIIQYSHPWTPDRWFGYGGDKITPPTAFDTPEAALSEYERLLRVWHKPYPATFIRLVGPENQVVREDELTLDPRITERR